MATKRKSIIEEALLEAKSLEDALKANTKEMLAAHMKQEIENIVESSLTEQEDEEVEVIDVEGSDEEMEEMPADAGEDSEGDTEEVDSEESELMDLDIDLDALAGDDDEVELDIELPADLDMGDEELDLTGASDEEVIAVFKKMSDEDEVEVVKDEDGIHLTDNETGAEYYIKEGDEHYEESYDKMDEESDCMKEEAGCGKNIDEEIIYEIELDEHDGSMAGDQSATHRDYPNYKGTDPDYETKDDGESHGDQGHDDYSKSVKEHDGSMAGDQSADHSDYPNYKGTDPTYHGDDGSSHGDQGEPDDYSKRVKEEIVDLDEEDEITEDKTQNNKQSGPYGGGRQRYSGAKAGTSYANESKKSRKTLSPKNVGKVAESKIMKEYKELKAKNEEYKGALKVFKNKLNEVALFNTNLAYVNRLFTEHSTTKTEKMEILKRFDSAESIKESKSIYKSVKSELDSKSPITESVENKVNKTVKSSKSDLNESTAYVDPQITAIKDLMRKIS